MPEDKKWKTMVFTIGGAAGLLIGLAAAFLFIRTREQSEGDYKMTSGQGLKIGMNIVSLLKMITEGGPR